MYYIYLIRNTKNKFVYVGSTGRSIGIRWKEHQRASKNGKTRLYKAMRKIGVENFYVEKLAQFKKTVNKIQDKNLVAMNEAFYIKRYNSYWFGYNDTTAKVEFGKEKVNEYNPKRGVRLN